jgi:L-lysine 2,3-aminomutase
VQTLTTRNLISTFEPIMKTCVPIGNLVDRLTGIDKGLSFLDFLALLRWDYLQKAISEPTWKIIHRNDVKLPECPSLPDFTKDKIRQLIADLNISWDDWGFHIKYRLHLNFSSSDDDFSLLKSCLSSSQHDISLIKGLILGSGEVQQSNLYDLSILPMNLLLDKSVVDYFVPSHDYFAPHSTKKNDPYGIVQGISRSRIGKGLPTAIIRENSKSVLGAHKFSHTFLFNVSFYCPVGCSNCYKSRMGTREYLSSQVNSETDISVYQHPVLGKLQPPAKGEFIEQARDVVRWMNEDTRGQQVYDVIISGGEPLWMKNSVIKEILNEFRCAENLKVLRICTGFLFLGLPFRFDDELLDILTEFSNETGVKVTIQAHLGNHHMISPEVVSIVQKIRSTGIPIYSQIPIKNGINFFLDDIDKSMNYLIEIGKRQVSVGIEPYMFIVDMHPNTNKNYVPIEPLMLVWSKLVESHDYPGLERPRTLSILCEEGNIILSGHTLFSSRKVIDLESERVIYHIPRVDTNGSWDAGIMEIFTYSEPLIPGMNDNPDSLETLKSFMTS